MKNSRITILVFLALLGTNAIAQNSVKNNFEASAKVENFCSIKTENLNFGVLNAPLTAQSANSKLRVLCTKNSAYSINLMYGLSEGQVPSDFGDEYTLVVRLHTNQGGAYRTYYQVKKNNVNVTPNDAYDTECNVLQPDKINLMTDAALEFFGRKGQDKGWYDMPGICIKNTGYFPVIDNEKLKELRSELSVQEYGKMKGLMKGNVVAYKITVPGDSLKTWSRNVNDVKSIGTGVEQEFDMNAQIVPIKSSSLYVAEDNYLDNVTAEISY